MRSEDDYWSALLLYSKRLKGSANVDQEQLERTQTREQLEHQEDEKKLFTQSLLLFLRHMYNVADEADAFQGVRFSTNEGVILKRWCYQRLRWAVDKKAHETRHEDEFEVENVRQYLEKALLVISEEVLTRAPKIALEKKQKLGAADSPHVRSLQTHICKLRSPARHCRPSPSTST